MGFYDDICSGGGEIEVEEDRRFGFLMRPSPSSILNKKRKTLRSIPGIRK